MQPLPRMTPPPCKSSLQRALLLAFLCGQRTRVRWHGQLAEDPRYLLDALLALGARLPRRGEDWLEIESDGFPRPARAELELGQNATALRCLCAIGGCLGGDFRFSGLTELRRRPLAPLPALLERSAGARFEFLGSSGRVPFRLLATGIRGPLRLALDLGQGSQAASGLLMAAAASGHGGEFELEGNPGYLDLTRQYLERFACRVEVYADTPERQRWIVPASGLRSPGELTIPADPSSAAWMLALFAARGCPLELAGLDPGAAHPDLGFVEDLRRLGFETRWESGILSVSGELGAGDHVVMDLGPRPDSFPPLVCLLSARPGRHRLGGAPKLRLKESDRVHTLAVALEALGFPVEEEEGGLSFRGRPLPGRMRGAEPGSQDVGRIELDSAGDHRMAIAFTILRKLHGLSCHISDSACIAKSWPGFLEWMRSLGP